MSSDALTTRILVVTGGVAEGLSLRRSLEEHLPGRSIIELASSLSEAADIISSVKWHFDAAVLDRRLRDGEAWSMIPLLRPSGSGGQPSVFVLLEDEAQNGRDLVRMVLTHPAITLVEKPYFVDELVARIIEDILPSARDSEGYYGLRLPDLLQAYSMTHQSATVRIFLEDGRMGLAALRGGQIIHAQIGRRQGLAALRLLCSEPRGRIRLDRGCTTAMHTIKLSTDQALLHIAQLMDEQTRDESASDSQNGVVSQPYSI